MSSMFEGCSALTSLD
ncbi:MAG: hypothetical protein II551_02550 [Paludibacteraceae bacterium]|nr:hypothetical protein [Paludibacteraceae bacterium]